MKRYIQFEAGDNPGDLTERELDSLLSTLGGLIGPSISKMLAGTGATLPHSERVEIARELLALNEQLDGGMILWTGTEDESPTPNEETVIYGMGLGNIAKTKSLSLLRGIELPTPEEILDSPPRPVKTYKWYDSKSEPGLQHRVTLVNGVPVSCTCKGMQKSGRCWHIKDALRGSSS